MSALSMPALPRQPVSLPTISRGSRYESDGEDSLSLLATTCAEQKRRLHTLALLAEYLASGAGGRTRQLLAREMQALGDLYEAVWCELGCAFTDQVVRKARAAIEYEAHYRKIPVRNAESNCTQETLF